MVLAFCCISAGIAGAQPAGQLPAALEEVGVTEHLGDYIQRDLVFQDEQGRKVSIGSYLTGQKPVLLNLVYHSCPMLCNLVLDGLTKSLRESDWVPGQEFDIVTVSFSSREGPDLAAAQKEKYLSILGKPEAAGGWHFLTGSEAAIQALARSVGFQFHWVEAQQQFAHPAVLIFLSGEGKITRYLYGLDYPTRDVRTALVEASQGEVGNTIDKIILYCFQYDPQANSYVPHAINIMKLGGLLTVLALGAVLAVFWRRERKTTRGSLPESWESVWKRTQ